MTFQSWRSFDAFNHEIRRGNRYFHSEKSQDFLKNVAETCASREQILRKGWITWRAQLGHDWRKIEEINDYVECAHPPERMKPFDDRAGEGRINPKGIPALYLATRAQTAMSEVRPWLGSYISLAQFKLLRNQRIVDCSKYHSSPYGFYFEEPDELEREKIAWANIDRAFSEPVTNSDDRAYYATTQIIAELFKKLGYDGVAYKSKFGDDGYNIALFDLSAAKIINCQLHVVRSLDFSFDECDNPYYVQKGD